MLTEVSNHFVLVLNADWYLRMMTSVSSNFEASIKKLKKVLPK